ncbi:trypsin-like serine protease [Pyxidicoccus fallax]|uniref:FG-GAP-like repeat-containing protein n=1 Tax=Pyxidicoccus fallax TaxID=394095 RepID=UPI001494B007|nr:FG-GAP-like repeat-containing protein [Pyxidicoccus fallax]NPC86785.1 trypsin-like serine protease [Pyxidicoccus fallax]
MSKLFTGSSRGTRLTVVLGVVASTSLGCGPVADSQESGPSQPESREDEVIHLTDDRMDVYAHPDPTLRARAMYSTPVMMYQSVGPTLEDLTTSTRLGNFFNLCSTERFRDDPILADCSGVLIDDDLVLSAAHCIKKSDACGPAGSLLWVFKYYRPAAGAYETITTDDVFRCKEIVAKGSAPATDFVVTRLNRPAAPRFTPAPVAYGRQAVVPGHSVATIGAPSGIPLKIAANATVTSGTATDNPAATLDILGGNSGGAVYSTDGYTVAGVVHSAYGPSDEYQWDGTCRKAYSGVNVHGNFYVMPAILDTLCSTPGVLSQRLCAPVKGHADGVSPAGVFSGGAFDRRNLGQAVSVEAVFDLAGATVTTTANRTQRDILRRFGITGNHGFSVEVPAQFRDGVNHIVDFYAIDPVAQTRVSLGRRTFNLPLDRTAVALGSDFDRNGHADLLWFKPGTQEVSFWFLEDTTMFGAASPSMPAGAAGWELRGTGDFNRDGHADLLWFKPGTQEVSFWLLDGTTVVGTASPSWSVGAAGWELRGTGDFNRDGHSDLLWFKPGTQEVNFWYLNGSTVLGAASPSTPAGAAGWDLRG